MKKLYQNLDRRFRKIPALLRAQQEKVGYLRG